MGHRREEDRLADAVRLGLGLFLGAGVAVAVTGLVLLRWPLEDWHPWRLIGFGAGTIAVAAVVDRTRERVSLAALAVLAGLASVAIGVGHTIGTASPSFGVVLLLWVVLFSFAALPRAWAVVEMLITFVVLAAVLAVEPGWPNPAVFWVFLALTFGFTGWTVSGLVDRERAARDELAAVNRTLEERVAEQVEQVGRLSGLRRFLPAPVADALLSSESGGDEFLRPHRRQIAVLFCDLRGFTAFSASAEPEEVTELLADYHAAVGRLVARYEATVGLFAGDGVMVYFGDPVPTDVPAEKAVRLALDLAEPMAGLAGTWQKRGLRLGHGVGIAFGYATLGMTGFEGRYEYTANGPVVNLASRLSDAAQPGQVLLDPRAAALVDGTVAVEAVHGLALKGFGEPMTAYAVVHPS